MNFPVLCSGGFDSSPAEKRVVVFLIDLCVPPLFFSICRGSSREQEGDESGHQRYGCCYGGLPFFSFGSFCLVFLSAMVVGVGVANGDVCFPFVEVHLLFWGFKIWFQIN